MKCDHILVCLNQDIDDLIKGQFVSFDKTNKAPRIGKDIILTTNNYIEFYENQTEYIGVLSHVYINRRTPSKHIS